MHRLFMRWIIGILSPQAWNTQNSNDILCLDLLRTSLRQILRNQRRYRGVFLSISLGVSGLIIVLTMGDAIEKKIAANLELLGSATIVKATWDFEQKTRWHHGRFRPKDLEDLKNLKLAVQTTGFVRKADQTFSYKQTTVQGQVMGVDPAFFPTLQIVFSEGAGFTTEAVWSKRYVCVIGSRIRKQLFQGLGSPLGRAIWIGGSKYSVIGVLGGAEDREHSRTVFLPISLAWDHFFAEPIMAGIYVRAINWHEVSQLREDVFNLLSRNHSSHSESLEVIHYPEKMKTIHAIEYLVKFVLYLGLTLVMLLGAIGISNLMFLAVQERTVEIGLRKAVGATERVILAQFLIEAVATSVTGALAGMLLSVALIALLPSLFNMKPDYGMLVIGLTGGVILGIALGVVSGLQPARKASALEPAEAVRFE